MKVNATKVWSVTWKTLTSIVLLMMVTCGGIMLNEYFHSWEFQHRYGPNSIDKIKGTLL